MSKPLVIVQLLPALNNGGVERGTVEVANFLACQGHTSIVISAGGRLCERLHEKVQHITLSVGKKSLTSLLLINRLRKFFRQHQVDIVHARSRLPAWLAYFAIRKIKVNKPKFITTIHGLYTVKRYSSIMARGDDVIAVSQTANDYVQKNYAKYLKKRPTIIYRGINPNEFPYQHEADLLWLQKFYEKHHQLVGQKIVLLPGRITKLKGVKELKTWLLSKPSDAKLVLTADYQTDLKAAKLYYWFKDLGVDEQVIWIDLQSAMADLYCVADVVVSCSTRAESFGRTTAEALGVGTAVVGYNHGGVAEILSQVFPDGLVELSNQQQLADVINQTLLNKPLIENIQPFLLENMLKQTIKLYQEAVNDN